MNIAVPILGFLFGALLAVVVDPVALVLAGFVACVIAALRYRFQKIADLKLSDSLLFRLGLSVIVGASISAAVVLTLMSGALAM